MSVDVAWITAFFDVPTDVHDAEAAFWQQVTGTTLSPPRGANGEFATLVRPIGDDHLRIQRFDGPARMHLDLHVASIDDAVTEAVRLGAIVVADFGHAIMRSPAGLVFCFVGSHGERDVGPAIGDPAPHRPDVLCIDVPAGDFESELAFWSGLTGWPTRRSTSGFEEFAGITTSGTAMGLLVQRLGDDARTQATVHLDVSAGDNFLQVAAHHVELGAGELARFDEWVVLRDPAGLVYCVTDQRVDAVITRT